MVPGENSNTTTRILRSFEPQNQGLPAQAEPAAAALSQASTKRQKCTHQEQVIGLSHKEFPEDLLEKIWSFLVPEEHLALQALSKFFFLRKISRVRRLVYRSWVLFLHLLIAQMGETPTVTFFDGGKQEAAGPTHGRHPGTMRGHEARKTLWEQATEASNVTLYPEGQGISKLLKVLWNRTSGSAVCEEHEVKSLFIICCWWCWCCWL